MPTAPNQPPDVERIVEDAGQGLGVSANRGSIPFPAARPGNALFVQGCGDLDGREATCEIPENPGQDFGLARIDLEMPSDGFSIRVEQDFLPVGIGAAAREAASRDCGLHTSQGFPDQALEEDRADERGNAELDLIDMLFMDRVEFDVMIAELLGQPGHVLGVTGDALKSLAHDNVGAAAFDNTEQLFQAPTTAFIA